MSRKIRVVLLCEDKQHRAFVTRLIHRLGWKPRDLRIVQSPTGRGSAEHYVRNGFPRELQWLRSKGGEQVYLIVMVDGDAAGVSKRKASLSAACHELGVPPPGDADNVVICVPSWNIETWPAYLEGKTVDETNAQYPKMDRPRNCQPMVDQLVEMCRDRALHKPAPASLEDACTSYRRVFPSRGSGSTHLA